MRVRASVEVRADIKTENQPSKGSKEYENLLPHFMLYDQAHTLV